MNLQQQGCLGLQSVLFHKVVGVDLSLVVSAQQMYQPSTDRVSSSAGAGGP